jgi:5-methyltetrahydrofolate--homocysteine methyltransferase
MTENLTNLYNSVLEGNIDGVSQNVQAALDEGVEPGEILSKGMIAAMQEVGRLYEEGDCFVPEMLVAARAMQAGLALLKPHLLNTNVQAMGKVAVGTVKGDLHDIGKNLVGLMLEGAGFEVINLGVDVTPETFVNSVKTDAPDIIAMSALLTTTMPAMDATIAALEAAGVRKQVKVMIGGAPVTEEYARKIGADGFADDASRAVAVARTLMTS